MRAASRTWIEISGRNLRHNYEVFRRLAGRTVGVMPIVKANAYGHGIDLVAANLHPKPWGLGVAHGEEALQLRRNGYRGRIVVLSSWQPTDVPELVRQSVELTVFSIESLRQLDQSTRHSRRPISVHLKLDSGTTRIGFLESDLPHLRSLVRTTKLRVVGLYSHFANAEGASSATTKRQLKRFATLDQQLGLGRGIVRHIACTAAAIRYPEAYFGLLRVGIGLYGVWPSDEIRAWAKANNPNLAIRPVLRWKTRLLQIKSVPAGTSIGYGTSVRVKRATRVGILPVGYFDGYDRRLSNLGWVRVRGRRANVLGRVCMNLLMIDCTGIPAKPGEPVTLIGDGVSAEALSTAGGFIPYELLSRLNPEITRRLI